MSGPEEDPRDNDCRDCYEYAQELDRVQAENKKLREGLEKIKGHGDKGMLGECPDCGNRKIYELATHRAYSECAMDADEILKEIDKEKING